MTQKAKEGTLYKKVQAIGCFKSNVRFIRAGNICEDYKNKVSEMLFELLSIQSKCKKQSI